LLKVNNTYLSSKAIPNKKTIFDFNGPYHFIRKLVLHWVMHLMMLLLNHLLLLIILLNI